MEFTLRYDIFCEELGERRFSALSIQSTGKIRLVPRLDIGLFCVTSPHKKLHKNYILVKTLRKKKFNNPSLLKVKL